jgi:hypothetical protein
MLQLLNEILKRVPSVSDADVVGLPVAAILNSAMQTPTGITAFLNQKINAQLKKMLDVWSKFFLLLSQPMFSTPNIQAGSASLRPRLWQRPQPRCKSIGLSNQPLFVTLPYHSTASSSGTTFSLAVFDPTSDL